jgi:hypothetical protein
MRDGDVPQTVDEATRDGWTWLAIECLACKHKGEVKIRSYVDHTPPLKLATLAGKLSCKACGARRFSVHIGMYLNTAGGLWPERKPIAFDGQQTVRPLRE